MPLDGIVLSNIAYEIKTLALNARIDKIHQPEQDEIIMGVRGYGENHKLLLSANPSSPKVCFTQTSRENPQTAPLFCMVLRKHLAGGKIISVNQPGFERILEIGIESMNEMGDISTKRLIIEIMGKHSNIILVDENGIIIDSIKRVSLDKSSVRQVLPGREYTYPPSQGKLDPTSINKAAFAEEIKNKPSFKIQEAVYKSFSGISPVAASEICVRANIIPSDFVAELEDNKLDNLWSAFENVFAAINSNQFSAEMYFEENNRLKDFSSFTFSMFSSLPSKNFSSISTLINEFYKQKDAYYRNSQKKHDLKKLVANHIERLSKKKEILLNTLKDIENRDDLRLRGELITANIYSIKQGQTTAKLINFYDEDGTEIEIALDANMTPSENAQSYFKKYNKQKRTFENANIQIKNTEDDLYYLESVMNSLETNLTAEELADIRQELKDEGYVKKSAAPAKKKLPKKSKPMQFKSSGGFDIYVGKNNKQNDELTLSFADSTDIWLHTKNIPGSHVIIKTGGQTPPDQTIEEAANLAAFFSKGRGSSLVPVDYTLKKNVKKSNGAKPGMVIYNTYNTTYITPDEAVLESINEYGEIF